MPRTSGTDSKTGEGAPQTRTSRLASTASWVWAARRLLFAIHLAAFACHVLLAGRGQRGICNQRTQGPGRRRLANRNSPARGRGAPIPQMGIESRARKRQATSGIEPIAVLRRCAAANGLPAGTIPRQLAGV